MPSEFPSVKQVPLGNARFYPTVSNYMHLGHLWTWLLNQTFTPHGGKCILRFEDMTANAVCHTEPMDARRFGADFIDQCVLFGVPAGEIVWQSDRQEAYADAKQKIPFATWQKLDNFKYMFWLSKQQPFNWRSESVYEAVLSRVVDDHDYDVVIAVRGEELACENELYWYFWNLLYGTNCWKPCHIFIPLVRDWHGAKVSKSVVSGNYATHLYLRDLNLNPAKTIYGLARHYMNPTGAWSYVENNRLEDGMVEPARVMEVMRTSTINPDPEPLSEAEVDSWKVGASQNAPDWRKPGSVYYLDTVINKGLTATTHLSCPHCSEMIPCYHFSVEEKRICPRCHKDVRSRDKFMAITHWDCPKCKAHIYLNERAAHVCPPPYSRPYTSEELLEIKKTWPFPCERCGGNFTETGLVEHVCDPTRNPKWM